MNTSVFYTPSPMVGISVGISSSTWLRTRALAVWPVYSRSMFRMYFRIYGIYHLSSSFVNTCIMNSETKIDMLNYWIEQLFKYFKEIGFETEPIPRIVLDETPNPEDELFIKTGYYDPGENKLVLFIDNRHIKDILRTFCHEMVHRNQNIVNPEQFEMTEGDMPLA